MVIYFFSIFWVVWMILIVIMQTKLQNLHIAERIAVKDS